MSSPAFFNKRLWGIFILKVKKTKFCLFLLLLNGQKVTKAPTRSFWVERYHINFQRFLKSALRLGYIQTSTDLAAKLASFTVDQLKAAVSAYGEEITGLTTDQLKTRLLQYANQRSIPEDLSEDLLDGLTSEVYLLTDEGAQFAAGYQYLFLMHQYYFPDVIDFKKFEAMRKKNSDWAPWQCLAALIDTALDQAALYHNVTLSLLLLKHQVKLFRHVGQYQKGLDALRRVLCYELQSNMFVTDPANDATDLKRLTSYEIQELHFFLVQLDLPIEDFLMQFDAWLLDHQISQEAMTRPEMVSAVMFAYLEDFASLNELYHHILARKHATNPGITAS